MKPVLELAITACETGAKKSELPNEVDRTFWDEWLLKQTLKEVLDAEVRKEVDACNKVLGSG